MESFELITTDAKTDDTQQALIAGINNETYAIPLSSVLTIENVAVSEISSVDQEAVIYLRGKIIPLVYLDKIFKMESSRENQENITVVVCMHKEACFGLIVDKLYGQRDITKKSLGVLQDNEFFDGASILDDDVALIRNVQSFAA